MSTSSDKSSMQHNSDYRQGVSYLQNGEWEKAINIFESLIEQFPDDPVIMQALEEARFKADIETKALVKPRRWFLPWRSILLRFGILVGFIVVIYLGLTLFNNEIAPQIAQTRTENSLRLWQQQGESLLQAGRLDEASEQFSKILAKDPENKDALEGMNEIEKLRKVHSVYMEGVRYQESGEYDKALEKFTEISLLAPQTADVGQRIQEIKKLKELNELFAEAESAYQSGRDVDAIRYYEQLRTADPKFNQDVVSDHLFTLYMRMGKKAREQQPISTSAIQQAYDYYTLALTLRPRDQDAQQAQFLAELYLQGSDLFHNAQWEPAILRLRQLFDINPNYVGDVSEMLYESYVAAGDQYKASDDIPLAYEQYRKAALLPVSDTALAKRRMSELVPFLTPTPTPAPTATPTLIPTPTPIPTATPVLPTPTPQPLSFHRGQIAFYSADPDHPGLWLMDASGKNRRFYANGWYEEDQYEKMDQQYKYSPDGRFRVYVTKDGDDTTPQIYIQGEPDQYGNAPTWKVSQGFKAVCYDPQWSPDGARIVFVSQENGSDDIWVVNVDGTNPRNLTPNKWEWDKHPSWSPDGRQIVFWSNRNGQKNIYVMDADGRNVRNISNTQWPEWKPIWIR